MKRFRASSGPFRERPYYGVDEVDRLCLEELIAADLLPITPEPVRIERFIEKRFKVTVTYEDLPAGVLGYSGFGLNGVERIVVSRGLADETGLVAERRVSSTLAHEAGHCLLHGHLFALGEDHGDLFSHDKDITSERVLCRDEEKASGSTRTGYDGRWWELQANLAIGGLLLPRKLVLKSIETLLGPGTLGTTTLEKANWREAERVVSETFGVNPIVARIRLGGLFPDASGSQLTL